MGYDPNELEEQAEEMSNRQLSGEIVGIEETDAETAYDGHNVGENRDVIVLEIELEGTTEEEPDTFKETYSLPKGASSWNNPDFQLGQYRDRYGKLPEEGDVVDITTNEDGYYRVDTGKED